MVSEVIGLILLCASQYAALSMNDTTDDFRLGPRPVPAQVCRHTFQVRSKVPAAPMAAGQHVA